VCVRCAVTFDVVFALDDSSGVSADGWTEMQTLIKGFVNQFPVGPGQARIAVVRYSDAASIAFDLNEYRSPSTVIAAVDALRHLSTSAERNLADAFRITLSHLLIRGQRYFAAQVGRLQRSVDARLCHQCPNVANDPEAGMALRERNSKSEFVDSFYNYALLLYENHHTFLR